MTGDDDKYLIATSEQPICGFHKGEWMDEKELPKRYGGVSTCFRKEAGAHGKDCWGIFRVHQFDKVRPSINQSYHIMWARRPSLGGSCLCGWLAGGRAVFPNFGG